MLFRCAADILSIHDTPAPGRTQEAEIYSKTLDSVSVLEGQYGALWTACQRCQGSLHLDVLCTSRDCPIFYRRKKVQKDLNEAVAQLERFTDTQW